MLRHCARELRNTLDFVVFKFRNSQKDEFECPVCDYVGPFKDLATTVGLRKHAQCPSCRALERHRIQYLVLRDLLQGQSVDRWKMLHFAPEPFFRKLFAKQFGQYETADLFMPGVDHTVDLQELPFDEASYDFVFASHVLEHIPDDDKAISEIRRILKPNGIAVLPVPIVSAATVEYPEPNPLEHGHVRAPGFDYFDKYERHFSSVEKFASDSLPAKHQLYVFEDRSRWPTEECPLRTPMQGEKHIDIVPVCRA